MWPPRILRQTHYINPIDKVTRRLLRTSNGGMRAILFVIIAAAAASAQAPPDPKAAALGAQLARFVRQRTTAIENPAVQEYIEKLGRKLADADLAYTFALIAGGEGGATHEPLSLPGGFVFVSADLIRTAADEAELAGMLAHAMAHVRLPRPPSGGSSIPVIFVGGWSLGPGPDGSILPMSMFKTQRENESRADALAVEAMSAAGYDPEALIRYIVRLQPPAERSPRVFAALPDRDARIAGLRQAIAQLPVRTYQPSDSDEFDRIQEQVPNIIQRTVFPAKEPTRPALRRQN